MSNINNTKEQYELNRELAQMLKGGVIMDVTNAEQAKTAEAAGACAVMALERIPADIRAAGGVARMSDQGDPGCSFHSGYGKMPNRSFCGGTDFTGIRDRLHRRE